MGSAWPSTEGALVTFCSQRALTAELEPASSFLGCRRVVSPGKGEWTKTLEVDLDDDATFGLRLFLLLAYLLGTWARRFVVEGKL